MSKEFNKELGTEILEPKEVEQDVYTVDKDNKVKLETVKTIKYIPTTYYKMEDYGTICAKGSHIYKIVDSNTHEAKCQKCMKSKLILRAFHHIDPNGHIIDNTTKELLD